MYLETQKYLFLRQPSAYALESLNSELGIEYVVSPDEKLVILNYGLKSPKLNPICIECRALTLEVGTWKVVAKGFNRFFNLGEALELNDKFDWSNFVAEEKIDGSLIILYKYKGTWRINTRRSFAQGQIKGFNGTWQDLFLSAGGKTVFEALENPIIDVLYENYTFVFELVSPYTQVVKLYDNPKLYLLNAFDRTTGGNAFKTSLNLVADYFEVLRPKVLKFDSVEHLLESVERLDSRDDGFEGYVCRDINNLRLKVKNKNYLVLHATKGNGNIFLTKYLVPYLCSMKADASEIVTYFPLVKDKLDKLTDLWYNLTCEIHDLWLRTKDIEAQRDFALTVKDYKFCTFLFRLRKGETWEAISSCPTTEKFLIKYFGEI